MVKNKYKHDRQLEQQRRREEKRRRLKERRQGKPTVGKGGDDGKLTKGLAENA